MPDLGAFFHDAPRRPFHGKVFRLCPARFRHNTLSMSGVLLHGARYNIRSYFGALYTSLELETARLELARYYTVPPRDGFVTAAILVRLTQVVDLTRPRLLQCAGVTVADLSATEHIIPQRFGLSAWESGVEALVVPSAAVPGAKNLALFFDNQRPRWRIELQSVIEPAT